MRLLRSQTRRGGQCRNKSEPGKRRCKFHGGEPTGAKTREGLVRIAEAQRRRWAHKKASALGDSGEWLGALSDASGES